MSRTSKRLHALFGLFGCLILGACVLRVRQVEVASIEPTAAPTVVTSPVKAHLVDGSIIVYPQGVTIASDTLRGPGTRFDLTLNELGGVTRIPLDSIVGMENFRTGTNVPATVALSVPASALAATAAAFGTAALFVAIFGSCPTIYSDSAGTFVLEAESFSYSIAPLFENRDVDRLTIAADAEGQVVLEIRNEALETHYLNHLELIDVRHQVDETVVPDPRGQPLALRDLHPPTTAIDRAGRDVSAKLTAPDGAVFETDPRTLAGVTLRDMGDHIDLTLPAPPGADSVAIVLRTRNSLLTTVLLYDLMLGSAGARSLDWLGSELEQVSGALELGQWYAGRMGMRISVWDDGQYREVRRIMDTGPIAWKDIAAMIPVPLGDNSLRVRLSFVADEWRIDRVAIATAARRPAQRVIPATEVIGADGASDPAALRHLAAPDEQYLQTSPGQRFTIRFDTEIATPGQAQTLLLASQGYYTEWIRRDWIRSARGVHSFRPSDEMLLAALERWRSRQESFEAEFYNTRIPVR